jgi:hypothetical protein
VCSSMPNLRHSLATACCGCHQAVYHTASSPLLSIPRRSPRSMRCTSNTRKFCFHAPVDADSKLSAIPETSDR